MDIRKLYFGNSNPDQVLTNSPIDSINPRNSDKSASQNVRKLVDRQQISTVDRKVEFEELLKLCPSKRKIKTFYKNWIEELSLEIAKEELADIF